MTYHVSTDDHRRTLARLDESLQWARPRLVNLLNLVRVEIVFDRAFSESPPSIQSVAAAGLNFDESRRA